MQGFSFIPKGKGEHTSIKFIMGYLEGYMLYTDGFLREVVYWTLN
jgi:hypothetical protein